MRIEKIRKFGVLKVFYITTLKWNEFYGPL